ncbi:MAG: hypothetical protein AAGF11_12645 [Myxococcota bacterium]
MLNKIQEAQVWQLHAHLLVDIHTNTYKENNWELYYENHANAENRSCYYRHIAGLFGIEQVMIPKYALTIIQEMEQDLKEIKGLENSELEIILADPEMAFFLNNILSTDPIVGNLVLTKEEVETIDQEVMVQISGLSAQARRIASPMTNQGGAEVDVTIKREKLEPVKGTQYMRRAGYDKEKVKLEEQQPRKQKIRQGTLYWMYVIAYFNRKIALAAELYTREGGVKSSRLFEVALSCMYPRLRTLPGESDLLNEIDAFKEIKKYRSEEGQWIRDEYSTEPQRKEVTGKLKECDSLLKDPTTATVNTLDQIRKLVHIPFSVTFHRKRQPATEGHLDPVLALDAGAHYKNPTDRSTLGGIRKEYDLPNRCDISGTTTDAVGYSLVCYRQEDGEHVKREHTRTYHVLSCITTMCLSGHHSLDEMAIALTLADRKNEQTKYNLANPTTIVEVIGNVRGLAEVKLGDVKKKYYKNKMIGILPKLKNVTIEATDETWVERAWKAEPVLKLHKPD